MKIADRMELRKLFCIFIRYQSVRNVTIYFLSYNCVLHTSTPMFRPAAAVGHYVFVFQKSSVFDRSDSSGDDDGVSTSNIGRTQSAISITTDLYVLASQPARASYAMCIFLFCRVAPIRRPQACAGSMQPHTTNTFQIQQRKIKIVTIFRLKTRL